MKLEAAQIIRAAQVWVCDACGCHDAKTCGCKSTAHAEERAAKKEADRQRKRRDREKAKQNQSSRPTDADVEKIKESGAVDDGLAIPASLLRKPQGNGADPEASAEARKAEYAALDKAGSKTALAAAGAVVGYMAGLPINPGNPLVIEWARANPRLRSEFVRACWAEIMEARTGISADKLHSDGDTEPDEDRWIEEG
jgi:hypothetical protein